jgi:hypothetical protein
VTFTATGNAGPAAQVSKAAGDAQHAPTRQAVAVRPAVKVTDRFANPVAGVQVIFSITSGDGVLTGATQTTAADGSASVGTWTLGRAGVNTIAATATGAGLSGNPATFTASADEILLQPSKDTTIAGTIAVTRFVVPAGITVTVAAALTVSADSTVEINGRLRGACVPITIRGEREVFLRGTLDNTCQTQPDNAPALTIVAAGGYELDGATVATSGDIDVTNDTTVTITANRVAARQRPVAQSAAVPTCVVRNTLLGPQTAGLPNRANSGANGQHAAVGRPGATARLRCAGDLDIRGGVTVEAQDGGHGGNGVDLPGAGVNADASGGDGAKGGRVKLIATGLLLVAGSNSFNGGDGGDGGNANAVSTAITIASKAPNALAVAGRGGDAGEVELRSGVEIRFLAPTPLVLGAAGAGGNAFANGANGNDATALVPSQAGGDAEAIGGKGGDGPARMIQSNSIVNPQFVQISGGNGGPGRQGQATAGNGGNGIDTSPDAADGGQIIALGGNGGNALFTDANGNRLAPGGPGGNATFIGGNGGIGRDMCTLQTGLIRGGNAGNGGAASGGGGLRGLGSIQQVPGDAIVNSIGNAGRAGMGTPPGFKRFGGANNIVPNGNRINNGPNHQGSSSLSGRQCFGPNLLSSNADVTRTGPPQACNPPSIQGNFDIRNFSALPITVVTTVIGPTTYSVSGQNVPTVLAPGGLINVIEYWACSDPASFTATIRVTGTLAGTTYDYNIPVTYTIH